MLMKLYGTKPDTCANADSSCSALELEMGMAFH